MKLTCTHGYFKLEEFRQGEFSEFMSYSGLAIVRSGDHFTFDGLVGAPKYSIAGGEFLGCPTTETFEGEPWEVMRANGLVYDFTNGAVVPIETVLNSVRLESAGNFYQAGGMIMPGSVTDDGTRVTDYAASFSLGQFTFRYSEVTSE
jgi:hypothetical protein